MVLNNEKYCRKHCVKLLGEIIVKIIFFGVLLAEFGVQFDQMILKPALSRRSWFFRYQAREILERYLRLDFPIVATFPSSSPSAAVRQAMSCASSSLEDGYARSIITRPPSKPDLPP